MRIAEICTRDVVHCARDTSVGDMARLMRNHHVGDLIVTDTRGGKLVPVGIVTDRDLVVEVLAERVDPEGVTAGDLMATDLVTATDTENVYDAIWHMRSRGIRRLPVLDAATHALVGVLTADDVTEFLAEELTQVARIAPRGAAQEKARREPLAR
jgi:signal-transduction protein with cAMP-binding, CBS, and nucleotidyltransferase domain